MKKLIIWVLFTVMLCMSMMPSWASAATAFDNGDINLDNALHFFVRHWHTDDDTDGSHFQGGSLENSGDRYFVVVEGYIVPPNVSGTGRYEFYMVCQSDTEVEGNPYDAGSLVMIHNSGYVNKSTYVDKLDHDDGIITLSANELQDGDIETFSSYSVSAGHDAVSVDGDNLTITYDPDIHLVKAHAFYIKETMDVDGTNDAKVLGEAGISGNPEKDTGFITKDGKKIKVYDTGEGLHTDKTATAVYYDEDGNLVEDNNVATRTFNIDLEAWRSDSYPPQVAMVLDASGSMGFASDKPTPIRAEPGTALYNSLANKIGTYSNDFKIEDRFIEENLGGYYEINKNQQGNDPERNWYLNSVKHDPSNDYSGMKEEYFAKLVPQPTDNNFNFSKGNQETLIDYGNYGGWGAVPAKFDGSYGVCLSSWGTNNSGFLLESAGNLGDDGFTLSFTLKQGKNEILPNNDGDLEVLYIGPEIGNRNTANYFHVVRRDNNIEASFISNGNETASLTLPTAFVHNSKHVITFAYDGAQMTAYLDGMKQAAISVSNLPYEAIVFAPFRNSDTSTGEYFYVDSIALFKTALSASQIDTMVSVNSNKGIGESATIAEMRAVTGIDAFLTSDEVALFLNPHNTDSSKLGAAGYSYFVYDSQDGTSAYAPLGYCKAGVPGDHTNATVDGWYYSSYSSVWDDYYSSGTAKTLRGIYKDQIFTDRITTNTITAVDGEGAAPDMPAASETGNTNSSYTPQSNGPVKFYIDKNGYLRCCFTRGVPNSTSTSAHTSYVYELEDSEYVRTEALQRALGLFVTKLDEYSPNARVSAVRFSLNKDKLKDENLDKLVLLDWTSEPAISTKMMSLQWGDGSTSGTQAGDSKQQVPQYNYGLTGNTATERGLEAYIKFLKKNDKPDEYKSVADKDIPKYLILFTDGANTGDAEKAKEYADLLKEADYTIYTVLLDGGSMDDTTYNNARNFLCSLAGTKGSINSDNYFFSTKKAKEDSSGKYTNVNESDILTQVFVDEILPEIIHNLYDYNVQDYIDPRFDLVDGEGNLWHLDANGNVTKTVANDDGTTEDIGPSKLPDTGVPITINDESDDGAEKPTLYYDGTKDMYYLKWIKQTIPGSAVGATRLAVWNAQFTIRAKEDFIGGNAVLSNGNDKGMNYVWSSKDGVQSSSGTDKAKDGDTPSKGFPRTSVNVKVPREDVKLEQTIYMGESVNKTELAKIIIDAATEESADSDARLYWEYIDRFVNYFNYLKESGDKNGIIDKLHTMNRSGDYLDPKEGDSLETGRMKIISNRIYDLIKNGELRVAKLSELLLEKSTVLEPDANGESHATEEKYLYIPYIYLPDDPETPTNSTGNGAYEWDVLGYLYFHIDETHTADGNKYPAYPDDGILKDTDTRMSQLTVSFLARSPEQRKDWNNGQLIQEMKPKDDWVKPDDPNDPENKVYTRDTDYKPAAGKPITSTVITGTFTTKIVSGEVQLQVYVEPEARKGKGSFTYTADLVRTDPDGKQTVVGTLKVKSTIKSGTQLYTATFKPKDAYSYMGYGAGKQYGLAIGTYSLQNARGTAPAGYRFSAEPVLQVYKNDYVNTNAFKKGTDFKTAQNHLAVFGDGQAMLGTAPDTDTSPYTNQRFALFRVTLARDVISVPKTGDRNHPVFWLAIVLVGIAGLVLTRKYKRGTRSR